MSKLDPEDAPVGYGVRLRAVLRRGRDRRTLVNRKRTGCLGCWFYTNTQNFCNHPCTPSARDDGCHVIYVRVKPRKKS